jgi:cytochrome c biogenesis factor
MGRLIITICALPASSNHLLCCRLQGEEAAKQFLAEIEKRVVAAENPANRYRRRSLVMRSLVLMAALCLVSSPTLSPRIPKQVKPSPCRSVPDAMPLCQGRV